IALLFELPASLSANDHRTPTTSGFPPKTLVLPASAGLGRVVADRPTPRPLHVSDLTQPRRLLALAPDGHRRSRGLPGAGEADAVTDEDAAGRAAVDLRLLVLTGLDDSCRAEPAMGEADGSIRLPAPLVQRVIRLVGLDADEGRGRGRVREARPDE